MQRVYGYTRVSTAKQGEGVSLTVQKEAIIQFASKLDLEIIEWFEEKETAAKEGRPLFKTMTKKLKAGKAKGVIMHKIDRSARNLKDWVVMGDLIDRGIQVHFAHEGLDLQSRSGRLSADILAAVATDYIRNLREESIKGIYGRLEQGIYPFNAPLGYLNKGAGKPKEIDPIKGPLVQEAFNLYASKHYNLDELGEALYKMGLRNIRGSRLSRSGLAKMLNNPFYIGIIKIKGRLFEGIHEPLVSLKQFEQVKGILKGKTNSKTVNHAFLFRKFVKCGDCNYSLIGELQKGRVYYRCHGKACQGKSYRESYIDSLVQNLVAAIRLYPEEAVSLTDLINDLDRDWGKTSHKLLAALVLQKTHLAQKMEVLTDAVLDGTIDKETYEIRKGRLLKDIQGLKDKEQELLKGKTKIIEKTRSFVDMARNLETHYSSFTVEEKRSLVQLVTSNPRANGKKLEFSMKSPFLELANRFNYLFGGHKETTRRTLYTTFTYIGNTSPIIGLPLNKEQLKRLLDSLLQHFEKMGDIED